jgi:NIMA (never in mitosis gene a)-related kinase
MLGEENKFTQSLIGTPAYLSPEMVRRKKYCQKSDVWALGCLLYTMCTKLAPFGGGTFKELKKRIMIGELLVN